MKKTNGGPLSPFCKQKTRLRLFIAPASCSFAILGYILGSVDGKGNMKKEKLSLLSTNLYFWGKVESRKVIVWSWSPKAAWSSVWLFSWWGLTLPPPRRTPRQTWWRWRSGGRPAGTNSYWYRYYWYYGLLRGCFEDKIGRTADTILSSGLILLILLLYYGLLRGWFWRWNWVIYVQLYDDDDGETYKPKCYGK